MPNLTETLAGRVPAGEDMAKNKKKQKQKPTQETSMWITILLALMPLLQMFLEWLNKQSVLSDKQKDKINKLIFKCNQIRTKATSMGCANEGTPDAPEVASPDQLASDLIDEAIAEEGFHSSVMNVADVKGKLSDFISKLNALGFDWAFIVAVIRVAIPMILTGKFDWAAILALLEKLKPVPVPNPGPLTP